MEEVSEREAHLIEYRCGCDGPEQMLVKDSPENPCGYHVLLEPVEKHGEVKAVAVPVNQSSN